MTASIHPKQVAFSGKVLRQDGEPYPEGAHRPCRLGSHL